MGDFDELYPDFGDDDEEPEDLDTETGVVEAEESQNRTFIIGVIVLAAIFVLGIAFVAVLLLTRGNRGQGQVSEVELTNQANSTLAMATQTASFLTQIAPTVTDTPIPTETFTPAPPPTDTSTPEGGAATEAPTTEATGEGGAETPTPLSEVETPTAEGTGGLIEATPLGGESPTSEATGVGGPIQPTSSSGGTGALPETGFAGTAGLAGAGLAALALVAVVFVARKLRAR